MIEVHQESDFTITIADLISTMDTLDNTGDKLFTLNIWTHGRDLPFVFENHCHFEFLQESIRIDDNRAVMYIFYDEIEYIKVEKQ